MPEVQAGKLKILAVGSAKRMSAVPDVPTVAELGYPQLESLAWIGLLAPAGAPAELVARLNAETVKAMRAADTREALGRQGFDVVGNTAAEFAAYALDRFPSCSPHAFPHSTRYCPGAWPVAGAPSRSNNRSPTARRSTRRKSPTFSGMRTGDIELNTR